MATAQHPKASVFVRQKLFAELSAFAELDDAKYAAVTLEQIKAAAQKYLKPEAVVVAVVKP